MLSTLLQLHSIGHIYGWPEHYKKRRTLEVMDYHLIWVLSGRGFVVAEGRRYEAEPGDLISFRRGQAHAYGADAQAPWDILWVHFDGRLARSFVNHIREYGGCAVKLGLNAALRDHWMELVIFRKARGRRPSAAGHLNTGLYALLGLLTHRLEMQHTVAPRDARFDVHRLQTFIHNHLRDVITLDELAREANLSRSQFTLTFRKLLHVSPMQYVLQTRIAEASALITETSTPLKQIGEAVGCPDPYYFSRLFKKMTGTSPSAYREAKRPPAQCS